MPRKVRSRYRLADADCSAIVTTADRKELVTKISRVANIAPKMIYAGHGAEQAGTALSNLAIQTGAKALDPDDIDRSSFIIYTSGTTGRAKGVLLSIRGMLWIAASCWAPICELTSKDVVLSPLPLFHSYGLNLSVLSVLAIGASEHLMERFSPQLALELMQSGKIHDLPRRADHVSLSAAQGPGERCRTARQYPTLHLRRRHPAATLNRAFEERFKRRCSMATA